uniref:AP2/ERF domain-containing protein n=1 Tax=Physcomitrium patens TaxID=3218 RepID=A0A2K1JGY1_PHYPA|nr:hypothetical protein PHYPA_018201 [Physcomitrium patens]
MGSKIPRRCAEQASPRGRRRNSRRSFFGSTSPSSSISDSPSPPRRRDALRQILGDLVHPNSTAVPEYRGVRYRDGLGKYVSEIRPTKSLKKIWLGTYDTAREAARAFDIGNLCCKKNLPLNFEDSPRLLRKISSHLSPEAQRSAIAKLAKEVAGLEKKNSGSTNDGMVATHVDTTYKLSTQHSSAPDIQSCTYTEQPLDTVCTMEVASSTLLREGIGHGCFSFNRDLNQIILDDDLASIEALMYEFDFDQEAMDCNIFGDGYYPP